MNEALLLARFRAWLGELNGSQRAALAENWENVMNDAALDRVNSWIICGNALAELRKTGEQEGTS
jgi:hypothetical protein